ncbi:MAG: efflux RND transporter periplasmic adaptor subunit [Betaproteobacteria bacterium]|nr:efflux RND transporter periplasmic adaptor subunit [Betaproteobacteria bacterium]
MAELLSWLNPARLLDWLGQHPVIAGVVILAVAGLGVLGLIWGGKGSRRAVITTVAVALIVWGALWFADWVRPTVTAAPLFPPPVIGPQAVKAMFVKQRTIERMAGYSGAVYPFERVVVRARTNGFVEKTAYPGDRVQAGQILAKLETSELDPQLARARAELEYLRAELERDEILFRKQVIPASTLDLSRSKTLAAAAHVKHLETRIGYATLRAPSGGYVSERMVDPGQAAQPGQPLLAYDRLDQVRIRFNVAEQDRALLRVGSEAVIEFPELSRQAFEGAEWKDRLLAESSSPAIRARVTTIFPAVDPQSRLGVVEVLIPNPGHLLRSNTYVRGRLVTGRAENAWVVPEQALIQGPDGKTVIFLAPALSDQGAAEMREVKVGLRNGKEAQILSGLSENAYVINSGHRNLVDQETVTVVARQGGPS